MIVVLKEKSKSIVAQVFNNYEELVEILKAWDDKNYFNKDVIKIEIVK